MRKLALSTLFYTLAAAGPLAAGTVITVDRRDLPDGTAEPMTMSIEGQLISITGSDEGRFIFRGDQEKMLIVNDEDKTYMVLDAAMMQGIASQMDTMMKQVEAAIAQLPKEQQEMARRAMKQQMPQQGQGAAAAPTEEEEDDVRRTSERETRQGYPSVKYEVYEDDVKVQELWVTDWSNVQAEAELSAAMRSFGAFTERLMSSMGGLGAQSSIGSSVASWWHGIEGMPVVITEIENGTPVEESVVRSIETADLDATALFEVPDDYTLKTIADQ